MNKTEKKKLRKKILESFFLFVLELAFSLTVCKTPTISWHLPTLAKKSQKTLSKNIFFFFRETGTELVLILISQPRKWENLMVSLKLKEPLTNFPDIIFVISRPMIPTKVSRFFFLIKAIFFIIDILAFHMVVNNVLEFTTILIMFTKYGIFYEVVNFKQQWL